MDTGRGSDLVAAARAIAKDVLAVGLPRRWSHVCGVAGRAREINSMLPADDAAALVAAAWLHDIGYAPELVDTGFHPLDGARWLRQREFDPRVTVLVANHSSALIEADERGLAGDLAAEFPAERSVAADALVYCDLTTGPHGQPVDVVERLVEIRTRYAPDSVVVRFVDRAEADLIATVRRVEVWLRDGGLRTADQAR